MKAGAGRVPRRRAVTALVAALLFLAALPSPAVFLPRAPKPVPHGAAGHPHALPHGPEPELLRPAHAGPGADESLPGQRAAAEPVLANASNEPHWASPWLAEPQLRVRLSGNAALDKAQLRELHAELSVPLDAERLHLVSLADDALTGDALVAALGRTHDTDEQQLMRALRAARGPRDSAELARQLEPLRGGTVMLVAHIDHAQGAIVFKGLDGRVQWLRVDALEQAAHDAGVNLLQLGCRSGHHAGVGFIDDLNSLDAVRAAAQAVHLRPTSWFELLAAFTHEGLAMQIDPQRFRAEHSAELGAGGDGHRVAGLRWVRGAQAPTRGLGEASAAAEAGTLLAAEPPLAMLLARAWPPLAVLSLVSLLLGLALRWRALPTHAARVRWLVLDLLGHALLLPLLLSLWVESVSGADAVWWCWGSLDCFGAAAGLMERHRPSEPARRGLWQLLATRAAAATVLFALTALARLGWLALPPFVLSVLNLVYALGRRLPNPVELVLGACFIYWMASTAAGTLAGWKQRLRDQRTARARHEQADRALEMAAVPAGRARNAALRSRRLLETECLLPPAKQPRWDQLAGVTEFFAPDPWAGQVKARWLVVTLPVELEQAATKLPSWTSVATVYGIQRRQSAFMHALPKALVTRWQDGQLQIDELPPLLASLEPRLRAGDFMMLKPLHITMLVIIGTCGLLMGALLLAFALGEPDASGKYTWSLVAALVLGLVVGVLPLWLLVSRLWHRAWLARVRLTGTLSSLAAGAEQADLLALMAATEDTARGTDTPAIEAAIKTLADGTEAFAAARMNQGIRQALAGRRIEDV